MIKTFFIKIMEVVGEYKNIKHNNYFKVKKLKYLNLSAFTVREIFIIFKIN